MDCANGAATAEAPELFRTLGIQATFIHVSPDGKNINEQCGALHPETLGKQVAESRGQFDLGVTFDGDADRALFCDAEDGSSMAMPCCWRPPATCMLKER